MKINEILKEDQQITAIDPNDPKKPVTVTDPETKVTTTYPDALSLSKNPDGTVSTNNDPNKKPDAAPQVGDKLKPADPNKPVAEERGKKAKVHVNFTPEDLGKLNHIKDLGELKQQAFALISNEGPASIQPEKIEYFKNRLEMLNSRMAVIKMMYDMLLSGEGLGVIGSRNSTEKNSYRSKFVDEDQDEDDTIDPDHENLDVGGDKTDRFINDIQDHEFSRSARGHNNNSGQGRASYAESAELIEMLRIAGLR